MPNYRVTAINLNVRSEPDLESDIIEILKENDVISQSPSTQIVSEVKSRTDVRTWMKIDVDGIADGWVSLKNLSGPNGADIYRVDGNQTANIRQAPTLSAVVQATLSHGEEVAEGALVAEADLSDSRRWVCVDLEAGRKGWVSLRFLEQSASAPHISRPEFIVTATKLNVRREPGLFGEVVGTLEQGATVPDSEVITADGRRWLRVSSPVAGFVSTKFLSSNGSSAFGVSDFPWYRIAVGEVGVKEVEGVGDNPTIVEYHKTTTLSTNLQTQDETAWCSSFVNWCVQNAGYDGTDSALARSWLKWGKRLPTPQIGCVVIFKRGKNPRHGHVGLFVKEDSQSIYTLGGNQSNAVNVSEYPKARLLGYRGI